MAVADRVFKAVGPVGAPVRVAHDAISKGAAAIAITVPDQSIGPAISVRLAGCAGWSSSAIKATAASAATWSPRCSRGSTLRATTRR